MKPRDERVPGNLEPMLSHVESAELHAQIAGMILAAKNVRPDVMHAWERDKTGHYVSADRCKDAIEQARELLTQMGLFRLVPGVRYGEHE
jgi:hypothetical protein